MKKVKYSFIVLFLIFCFNSLVYAQNMIFAGFNYGVNYFSPSDSRFDAYSTQFILFIPINQKMKVGYLHENVNINGKDGSARTNGIINVDALRVILNLFETGIKNRDVDINALIDLGIGDSNIPAATNAAGVVVGTSPIIQTRPIGDIGFDILYHPDVDIKGIKGALGINLLYRFFKVPSTDLFGTGNTVDNLGGFSAGIYMSIFY